MAAEVDSQYIAEIDAIQLPRRIRFFGFEGGRPEDTKFSVSYAADIEEDTVEHVWVTRESREMHVLARLTMREEIAMDRAVEEFWPSASETQLYAWQKDLSWRHRVGRAMCRLLKK